MLHALAFRVQSEHVGDNRCEQVGGQRYQRGVAGGADGNAVAAQPCRQRTRANGFGRWRRTREQILRAVSVVWPGQAESVGRLSEELFHKLGEV